MGFRERSAIVIEPSVKRNCRTSSEAPKSLCMAQSEMMPMEPSLLAGPVNHHHEND
jgi:hypothetical protein